MVSDRTNISSSHHPADLEQELLQLVLGDHASYPWEPDSQTSQAFFSTLEQQWLSDESSDEVAAINSQGQVFFDQLAQSWMATPSMATHPIQAKLVEHFGDRVPQSLLDGIVQQAQTLLKTQEPLADQLVQCVQTLLSGWATDDLLVLARPYAYAMRGNDSDALEAALRSVRYAAWTELSGVEQARLSLAIARYTLSQLPTENMP